MVPNIFFTVLNVAFSLGMGIAFGWKTGIPNGLAALFFVYLYYREDRKP